MKKTAIILAFLLIFGAFVFTSCVEDDVYFRIDNPSSSTTEDKNADKTQEDIEIEKQIISQKINELKEEKDNLSELLKEADMSDEDREKIEGKITYLETELAKLEKEYKDAGLTDKEIKEKEQREAEEKEKTGTKIEILDKEEEDYGWGAFVPVP